MTAVRAARGRARRSVRTSVTTIWMKMNVTIVSGRLARYSSGPGIAGDRWTDWRGCRRRSAPATPAPAIHEPAGACSAFEQTPARRSGIGEAKFRVLGLARAMCARVARSAQMRRDAESDGAAQQRFAIRARDQPREQRGAERRPDRVGIRHRDEMDVSDALRTSASVVVRSTPR